MGTSQWQVISFLPDNNDFEVREHEVFAVSCINLLSSSYTSGVANFSITAVDPGYVGDPDENSQVGVSVTIFDINDNPPEFQATSKVVFFDESEFGNPPVSEMFWITVPTNSILPLKHIQLSLTK